MSRAQKCGTYSLRLASSLAGHAQESAQRPLTRCVPAPELLASSAMMSICLISPTLSLCSLLSSATLSSSVWSYGAGAGAMMGLRHFADREPPTHACPIQPSHMCLQQLVLMMCCGDANYTHFVLAVPPHTLMSMPALSPTMTQVRRLTWV